MGAGFHPELSGRENIALSGAVLGMSDDEVAEAFDRIVDFAEIGEFLDSPVKHYSSGMYARLAFSVSAHLSAEVSLLVDEGLSAGDLRFAEKASAHIREIVRDGRTVVFVSHSLGSMQQLCDSGIVLDQGRMQFSGGIDDAVDFYKEFSQQVARTPVQTPVRVPNRGLQRVLGGGSKPLRATGGLCARDRLPWRAQLVAPGARRGELTFDPGTAPSSPRDRCTPASPPAGCSGSSQHALAADTG